MGSSKAKWIWLLLWMACALWPRGAAHANESVRPRVVILGDSLTAGYGVEPSQGYPALLQKKIDQEGLAFEVVNAGISGDTTAGGLRRIDWTLGKGAALLVVALGGNDGLRGVAPAQTAQNLSAILRKAKQRLPDVSLILTTMKMPSSMGADFARAFEAVFPQVAAENQAILGPFLLEGVAGNPDLNQADLIHPNAKGQEQIADNLWPFLREVLRKRSR
jgi:acyl-CoA thioesterase-1